MPSCLQTVQLTADGVECLDTVADKVLRWLQIQLDLCEPCMVICIYLQGLDGGLVDKITDKVMGAGCICTSSSPAMLTYESCLQNIAWAKAALLADDMEATLAM